MRDIVATIQAEQDRIIRAPLAGVLVVQGGPGTGKTVVALHRAAYLLYAHRDRLARSGVLVVGPNNRFLRYISQVLPSLGETGVVLATAGQLYPGIDAHGAETPQAAAVKGDLRMVRVLAGGRAGPPAGAATPVELLTSRAADLLHAGRCASRPGSRAQQSRKPHNVARVRFVDRPGAAAGHQLAKALNTDSTRTAGPS